MEHTEKAATNYQEQLKS